MDIQTVGIAGAGTMGSGIAQLLVQNDLEVVLFDVSENILARAEERLLKGLERAEKPGAFSLARKTTRIERLASCDMVIEAASENLAVKLDLFRALDSLVEPPRALATNTSSLSVSRIAGATENPRRVVGMHFFNPAAIMRLVEVVRGERTAEETVAQAAGLARRLGKTAVVCRDTPGFIANRVARPFYLTGMRLVEQGAGTPADIDRAVRDGGFRMGPLELADLIGLEVNLAISRSIFQALGSPERLKPSDLQARLVDRGCLGRKNSRGFYIYGENKPGTVNPILEELTPGMATRAARPADILRAVLQAVIREARLASAEGVAGEADIDLAMRLGLHWPKGPFEWDKQSTKDAC